MPEMQLEKSLDLFISEELLPLSFKRHALKWFKPSLDKLIAHKLSAGKVFFVGVNGSQGSGKSTFCELLTTLINDTTKFNAISLSLDDFYFNQITRNELARTTHSLFKTRGVPGTHDTDLMHEVLNQLAAGEACYLPSFDKSQDNPKPKEQWHYQSSPVDIVFLEGWCWGVSPESEKALTNPINQMEETKDAFGIWRKHVNNKIADEYQTLYEIFDYWIMLKAPDFDCVYKWRCEQEAKLRAKSKASQTDGSGIMNDSQILEFIQHYQRLTQNCLSNLPKKCDLVFELDKDRQIQQAIYK